MSVLSFSKNELLDYAIGKELKANAISQLRKSIYRDYIIDHTQIKNLKESVIETMPELWPIIPFTCEQVIPSSDNSATKYIFKLNDGHLIESVVLKEKNYATLCVSSQSGCPVGCKFCLTGFAGFKRNLTVPEIVGQVLFTSHHYGSISNLVFMGMGEPLLNYDNVFKAIDIMKEDGAFQMSWRKITVSTSGQTAGIKKLIKEKRIVHLAFSVGSAIHETRLKIMPHTERHPLDSLLPLLQEFQTLHGRKITLEYTLLKGVNDSKKELLALCDLAKKLNGKINLINLNPHRHIPFQPVTFDDIKSFARLIKSNDVQVTVRAKKGDDISAACGQLGESLLN